MEIVARIVQSNSNVLRTHATEAGQRDTSYLVNNPLSSFFSECTMSLNGEKISTTNVNFAHKSFIETDFSQSNDAKKTWLACRGYCYEDNPYSNDCANGRAEDLVKRKRIVAASSVFRLFGKIACHFVSCDKYLISGVTIRLSLRRSPNDFVIMSEHAYKHLEKNLEKNLDYMIEKKVK